MSGFSLKFAPFLLTACLCVSGLAPSAAAQKGGVRKFPKKSQKQEPATPPLPSYTPAPLQPVPLDQVPAVAPRVQYQGGELTIVAHNSTLADVLKAVRQQTGADLDIPPNASERVVADLGPGPARDVLAELLNGTHFNYVMVGSVTDPTAIQSIVLTPRSGAPDNTTAAVANRSGVPSRVFPGVIQTADAASDDSPDEPDTTEEQPDQTDQQNQQNPAQQTPKTPEQLLQELQRQQQQMQQQQQNPQSAQPPQGILPNQPPTAAPPSKPE